MKGSKTLATAGLVGVITLSFGFVSASAMAQTKPQLVNRGPNGAAFIVDKAPQTSVRTSSDYPYLVNRGPNGAAHIVRK